MKPSVVLYPSPGMGHLVPMVELGKLFLSHGLAVAIVTVDPPYNTGATAAFIARSSTAIPAISFHRLPPVSLPHNPSPHHEAHAFDLVRLSNAHLLSFLHTLSLSSPIRALVLDFFCTEALDVAAAVGVPAYFFFSTSASNLAAFLHLPILHHKVTQSFKDLGHTPLDFPGLPSIPASDMPLPMLDRDDAGYKGFVYHFDRMPRAAGIIENSFEWLEPRALSALRSGLCVPGWRMPPIHCVGPLTRMDEASKERHPCMAWLDAQPKASVVFLCFGSLGLFSAEQLMDIAEGLERSEQRFLWVVRSPPSPDPEKRFEAPPEPDLDALLPKGFIERTKERGLAVKKWAPQVEVLAHEAVGGFVTHCGWNSALEAVRAGVPMIAWPLYAEQRMNKVSLVEELRLAVEMRGYEAVVTAEEVEEKVRWLMASDGGKELREKTLAAKKAAQAALAEGGSSHQALMELVHKWRSGD
ncbi:UDP-glycosyltransferase 88B1-like [Cocos nucifera]|uniref:Glycosyltransferase n=1 Tax=Cocos nucifera TaxID=13894 RepID=A0A8K0I4H4_COCNU|nr:UDP-glycosyltransferase 88B1-like [Cocos nucifera]